MGDESRLIDKACQHAAAIRTEGMDIDAPADTNPSVEACVDEFEANCDEATRAASCMLDADTSAGVDDCMAACE